MTLELTRIKNFCPYTSQLSIYGFNDCMYQYVGSRLQQYKGIKKVFCQNIHHAVTLEGRSFEEIPFDYKDGVSSRSFKSIMVSIVLENYKRKKEKKPLIPTLFCISFDTHLPTSAEQLASKNPELNKLFTHSEMRRAYKLCEEFEDEEVRAVAQETFKFVRVEIDNDVDSEGEFYFLQVDAPWKREGWSEAWKLRKEQGKRAEKKEPPAEEKKSSLSLDVASTEESSTWAAPRPKKFPWREVLKERIAAYKPPKPSCSCTIL